MNIEESTHSKTERAAKDLVTKAKSGTISNSTGHIKRRKTAKTITKSRKIKYTDDSSDHTDGNSSSDSDDDSTSKSIKLNPDDAKFDNIEDGFKIIPSPLTDMIVPVDNQGGTRIAGDIISGLGTRCFIWGIIGKRRSGKSTIILQTLRKFFPKHCVFTRTILVSPTAKNDPKMRPIRKAAESHGTFFSDVTTATMPDIIKKIQSTCQSDIDGYTKRVIMYTNLLEQDYPKEAKNCRIDPLSKETEEFLNKNLHKAFVKFTALNPREQFPKTEYENGSGDSNDIKQFITPYSLLIFDDAVSYLGTSTVHNKNLNLFLNSAHSRCNIIITSQTVSNINNRIFSNIDALTVYPFDNETETKRLMERCNSTLMEKVYRAISKEDYGFMHINFAGPGNKKIYFKRFDPVLDDSIADKKRTTPKPLYVPPSDKQDDNDDEQSDEYSSSEDETSDNENRDGLEQNHIPTSSHF